VNLLDTQLQAVGGTCGCEETLGHRLIDFEAIDFA
jgi:hypothetical protein